MDKQYRNVHAAISNDTHDTELKYIDELECQKSNKDNAIINGWNDGNNLVEMNTEAEHPLQNKNASVLLLQTNDTCDEAVLAGNYENMQGLSCIHKKLNDYKDAAENEEYHHLSKLSAKAIDPFDLSDEEGSSREKYQPIIRKFKPTNDTFEDPFFHSGKGKNQPKLPSCVHTCLKKENENKANHSCSSPKATDPFDLLPEEISQERYQPVKKKLCHVHENNNFSKDSHSVSSDITAADVFATEPHVQAVLLPTEVVMQNVLEAKRLKTTHCVVYVHSQELLQKANELIRINGRAELVHSLIQSFGLLRYIEVVSPRTATDVEILGFHCPDYINFFRDVSISGDAEDSTDPMCKEAESCGLSYDCPVQKGLYEACCLISGATIVAAERLINNSADIAINWYGGWHHAKRDSASGFCYINDIVLGILKLREKYDRILYVDIDLHHGDGVEEAFCTTPKVMTVSFHKYMSGFFPGSGPLEDVGSGKGKFYSVNVPLLDGIKDAEFFAVFCRVMQLVNETFKPKVIVMQCGADSLSLDPMASFNLTHCGIARCVGLILSWNLPTLLLGGGGYNFPNTAKCWTFLTSLAAGKKLPLDIPEHDHLLAYGPDFEMSTTAGNRKDSNTKQYLTNLLAKISRLVSCRKF